MSAPNEGKADMTSLTVILALLFGWDVLEAPPRDLASLVDPVVALEQMGVNTDEQSLIAVLEEGPATDEATWLPGDDAYAKRLFAMRRLGRIRSRRAVAAFREILGGEDPTLREMARRALAAQELADYERPTGTDSLAGLAEMVPADVGFAVALDLERGSKVITFEDCFASLRAKLGKGADALFGGPERIEQTVARADEIILRAVSLVGNVRLDALALAFSEDLGPDQGYVCALLKGLYDPARAARALQATFGTRETEGQTVFYRKGGPALCLLDETTAVVSFGPGENAEHMERVLKGMAARRGRELPPPAAPAFRLVRRQQARMAFSGTLSAAQKAKLKQQAEAALRELQGDEAGSQRPLRWAVYRLILAIADVDMFAGHSERGGQIVVSADCTDPDGAQALQAALSNLEQVLRSELVASLHDAPAPVRDLLSDLARDGATLWRSRAEGTWVHLRAEFGLVRTLIAVTQAGQRAAQPPAVPTPP